MNKRIDFIWITIIEFLVILLSPYETTITILLNAISNNE